MCVCYVCEFLSAGAGGALPKYWPPARTAASSEVTLPLLCDTAMLIALPPTPKRKPGRQPLPEAELTPAAKRQRRYKARKKGLLPPHNIDATRAVRECPQTMEPKKIGRPRSPDDKICKSAWRMRRMRLRVRAPSA